MVAAVLGAIEWPLIASGVLFCSAHGVPVIWVDEPRPLSMLFHAVDWAPSPP